MRAERSPAAPPGPHHRQRHFEQGAAASRSARCIRPNAVTACPRAWLSRYFAAEGRPPASLPGDGRSSGRRSIFRRLNLMEAYSWPRPFPVIFCRNVMIYFDRQTQERVIGETGRQPGAGRLSVRRPCGEPDARLAFARIRAAGDLPEAGKEGGQVEQIIVGMADCRVGNVAGQVLATYALGSLHRARRSTTRSGRWAGCCTSCCRIRPSIRRAAGRTRTCSPIPAFRCCSNRSARRAHRSAAWWRTRPEERR